MAAILITGAGGFLGKRAVRYFEAGNTVVAPSHSQLDITDAQAVQQLFAETQPDYVIHCAAISDIGQCDREPERSRRINIDGSVNIAAAVREHSAKCLVCSSDQVYAGSELLSSHREDEVLRPSNLYGREKLEMEQRVLDVNPDCVLMRLTWMYDRSKWDAGEKDTFFSRFADAVDAGQELTLRVNDRRGLTDVCWVLENMKRAFTVPGGVYNFGCSNDLTLPQAAVWAMKFAGMEGKLSVREDREAFSGSVRNLTMDLTKAEAAGLHFPTTAEALAMAAVSRWGKAD